MSRPECRVSSNGVCSGSWDDVDSSRSPHPSLLFGGLSAGGSDAEPVPSHPSRTSSGGTGATVPVGDHYRPTTVAASPTCRTSSGTPLSSPAALRAARLGPGVRPAALWCSPGSRQDRLRHVTSLGEGAHCRGRDRGVQRDHHPAYHATVDQICLPSQVDRSIAVFGVLPGEGEPV